MFSSAAVIVPAVSDPAFAEEGRSDFQKTPAVPSGLTLVIEQPDGYTVTIGVQLLPSVNNQCKWDGSQDDDAIIRIISDDKKAWNNIIADVGAPTTVLCVLPVWIEFRFLRRCCTNYSSERRLALLSTQAVFKLQPRRYYMQFLAYSEWQLQFVYLLDVNIWFLIPRQNT